VKIELYIDSPFGDQEAFRDFLGHHEIAHETINHYLARKGHIVTVWPLSQAPQDSTDWLLDHNQMHKQIGDYLGLSMPDISEVDLNNQGQYADWMLTHGQMHQQIDQALNINT
jgi:hypothetical protein